MPQPFADVEVEVVGNINPAMDSVHELITGLLITTLARELPGQIPGTTITVLDDEDGNHQQTFIVELPLGTKYTVSVTPNKQRERKKR